MMAPVDGSGDWPAWMARVAIPGRLGRLEFMSGDLLAQMVEQIDTGDDAVEFAVLLDYGDMVAGEDRQEIRDRRFRGHGIDAGNHGVADRQHEFLWRCGDGEQQV